MRLPTSLFRLLFLVLFFSTSARAEFMGLVPGRSANIADQAQASIEFGTSWYTKNLQWSTARINFKPSESILLFFDYASLGVNRMPISATITAHFPGYGVGGGILFSVPDFFPSFDVAFLGNYHSTVTGNADVRSTASPQVVDLHQWQLAANMLFSPIDPVYENGLFWYASIGYVSTGAQAQVQQDQYNHANPVSYRQKNGLAAGAGVVLPFGDWNLYGGVEWLADHPLLSGGVRYAF